MQKAIEEISAKYPDAVITEIGFNKQVQRFGDKKHVWVIGHSWEYKGNEYFQAVYGSWREGSTFKVNSWDEKEASKQFKTYAKKMTSEINTAMELEKKIKHKECREKWLPIYEKATGSEHEYLDSKKIGRYNSRTDSNSVLIIPIYNENGFVGVQRIFKNLETMQFEKRFAAGVEIKGGFSALSPFKDAPVVYLSEGFSTAASVQAAFPDVPSICAFNAGNLAPAIQSIRKVNPNCRVIIAADFDHTKERAGQKKAYRCTKIFANCIYKTPKFSEKNNNWTDFNDLHCFESLDKVKEQLTIGYSDFNDIIPMGHKDNMFYYYSTSKKTLFNLPPNGHNKNQMLLMAPESFWANKYGCKYDEDDNPTETANWNKVTESLGIEADKKGFFNVENMRGYGCWKEKGKLVFNDGENIFSGKEKTQNFAFKSKYFYESNTKLPEMPEEATIEECHKIVESFKQLSFKNKFDYIYVLGWVAQAQVFGALDWRPTLWITGSKGSGKSTLLNYIHNMIDLSIHVRDSTRAGIIQTLKNDALAVIYDESEEDSDKIGLVIETARQASTLSESKVLRGSQSGKAMSFNTNTCFCFGSIRQPIFNSADASRIFSIEMVVQKGNSFQKFKEIDAKFHHIRTLNMKLRQRFINNFELLKSNIDACKMYCQSVGIEARQADQLSVIMGSYWLMLTNDKIGQDEAKVILGMLNYEGSEYQQENDFTDENDCYDSILGLKIDNEGNTIGSALNQIVLNFGADNRYLEKKLAVYGVGYVEDNKFFIRSKNPYLSAELRKITQFSNFAKLLRRTDKFIKNHQKQLCDGLNRKGVLLKM